MQFGIHSAFHADSVDLAEFATRCEALGFESFWLPEHSVIPVHPSVSSGGVPGASIRPDGRSTDWLDGSRHSDQDLAPRDWGVFDSPARIVKILERADSLEVTSPL